LSNPLVYIFLRICLLIEATGICAGAWFMASIHKKVAGFQLDEVYVGTPEERAAGDKPDNSIHPGREFTMGTNVLNDVPTNWEEALDRLSAKESFSVRRERMLKNIRELRDMVAGASTGEEKETYEKGIAMEIRALNKLNVEEEESTANVMDTEAEASDVELGEA
jgi:hypothetical protein